MIDVASKPSPHSALQPQRIAASALAIAIHLAAFGLLLAPLASPPASTEPAQRTQVQWRTPEVPSPPPPPMITPPAPTRPVATPTAPSVPLPLSLPVLVDHVDAAAVTQAALALTPVQIQGSPADPVAIDSSGQHSALQLLHAPAPPYPPVALRQQLQGEVLLRVLVDSDGRAEKVTIERSSGHRVLDQAARNQVLAHWRFAPPLIEGKATAAQGLVPINFAIH